MKSNFEFLEQDFPILAKAGALAEKYCVDDPNSALFKLGTIGETVVNLIFEYDRIDWPSENTAAARIVALRRKDILPRDVADILHALRKARNLAVHQNYESRKRQPVRQGQLRRMGGRRDRGHGIKQASPRSHLPKGATRSIPLPSGWAALLFASPKAPLCKGSCHRR